MRISNIVAGCIGIAFSILAIVKTYSFKKFKNVPVGPEFFPRYLALGLCICCIVLVVQNVLKGKDVSGKDVIDAPSPTLDPRNKDIQRTIIGLVVVVVSALLWNVLGFLIVTPLTLLALMWLLGKRNYIMMIVLAIAITAVVFMAFKLLLGIKMPLGFMEG